MKDPSVYELSHCFPSMARNAASKELAKALHKIAWTLRMTLSGLVVARICVWTQITKAEATAENRPDFPAVSKEKDVLPR